MSVDVKSHDEAVQNDRAVHHDPTRGNGDSSLNRLAFSATLHCLTGCAIGEVTGMFIARALGWGPSARSHWRSAGPSCSATP